MTIIPDRRMIYILHVDPTNTKLAQNNIKTQGPLTWNKLNIKIKNSPSLASFKTNLKKTHS